MKSTDQFKITIEEGLRKMAFTDSQLAQALKKKNKNIDDCCTYIINQVKKNGANGFTDDEIFSWAKHYFFEDNVKPGSKASGTVIVNHQVKLTPEEIAKLKEQAREEVIAAEKKRLTTKKKTKVVKENSADQPTLL